uniref:Omega-scoloptoxin n=1 Tax=Hemiscolopendra marginata TaxID=943146 RepID=A0A646QFD7_9MYRI
MRCDLVKIYSSALLIVWFSSSSEAIKCITCGTIGSADGCKSPLPSPEDCTFISKTCFKIEAEVEGTDAVFRGCGVPGMEDGCQSSGQGKVCKYICSTDGCNLAANFLPNNILMWLISLSSMVIIALFKC